MFAEVCTATSCKTTPIRVKRQVFRESCRYAFQLWKPLGHVFSETVRKMPTSTFSSYYKGGFEPKMTKREANLILGISPTSTKPKVREAHRRIMVLNHPDKGESPYLAAKINEEKYLLDKETRR
ncbi:dnaJ homolog subfamily C member 15-like [Diretmus argenteus]